MALTLTKDFDKKENLWIVKPVGEIDIYTSPKFKEFVFEALDEKKGSILIDGEKLEYIDSTGLGVLISALKRVKEDGNDIIIQNIKSNIYKLFDITGLNKVFIIRE